jgi:hypothetical protein
MSFAISTIASASNPAISTTAEIIRFILPTFRFAVQ